MAKRQPKRPSKKAEATPKGDPEPVVKSAPPAEPDPSDEERAQTRVTRAMRELMPEFNDRILSLERRLKAAEQQISAVGNSINTQPPSVEVAADPYFSKGPKSTDDRTSG